jgi:hypothetical protein
MLDFAQHLVTSIDLSLLDPASVNLASPVHFNISDLHDYLSMDLIAQQFKQDVVGDLAKGWDGFVKSGQIWAMIIGVIVGYLFRSITNS